MPDANRRSFLVMAKTLTGHCLCGKIAFEVTEPPLGARYCHCRRCQRRTGTGSSVNAAVQPGTVRVVQGAELLATFVPPDGASKSYCPRCGGHLFSSDGEDVVAVRMGAFDDDPGVRPDRRQWVSSMPAWDTLPDDGLARYDGPAPAFG